eukprot:30828-Pelagococcus_subviridis.AAC.28
MRSLPCRQDKCLSKSSGRRSSFITRRNSAWLLNIPSGLTGLTVCFSAFHTCSVDIGRSYGSSEIVICRAGSGPRHHCSSPSQGPSVADASTAAIGMCA